jgi:hypothetical protein
MTRTILAVGLLGRTRMSHSIPNTRLTPATHTGKRHQQDGGTTAGGLKLGELSWPQPSSSSES